ncbi:MAG: COX15/CtaA family protein [Candidatus Sumerlaeia bacterium]|nr:COX15/CtaA family protein [Candidatus Sumerlaeia bacterium]
MDKGVKLANGLLIALVVICFGIVTLGGWVRLTGSGMAIPEWPFFTVEVRTLPSGEEERIRSVFPPRTDEGWVILRDTFVEQVPGFESGIGLEPFKYMFWIEWGHRAVAKFIGVVYLAFLGVVFWFPSTRRTIGKLSIAGLFVLVSQAFIGGLVVWFHLPAVKVALHLIGGFLFTSVLVWMLMRLVRPPVPAAERKGKNPILPLSIIVFLVVLFQIFSGGLMAGSHAGFQMNTWPKMGDFWVPPGMFADGLGHIRNFTENTVMIQFFHRWFAFIAVIAVIFLVVRTMTVQVSPVARWALRGVVAVVVLQTLLGILTLISGVRTDLALIHQGVGLVLLLNLLVVIYETKNYPVLAEEALLDMAERREDAPEGEALNV